MAINKRDWLFVALIVIVLGFFLAISGEEKTTRVPKDDTHLEFHSMVKQEGKKATEKFCKECHNGFYIVAADGIDVGLHDFCDCHVIRQGVFLFC